VAKGNCQRCGIFRESLHREHIIPAVVKRKRGEDPDKDNIQYLCANCHEDKTKEDSRSEEEWGDLYRETLRSNSGKTFSIEHRQRISQGRRGVKTGPMTEEQKKRIGESNLSKHEREHSIEDCKRISEGVRRARQEGRGRWL